MFVTKSEVFNFWIASIPNKLLFYFVITVWYFFIISVGTLVTRKKYIMLGIAKVLKIVIFLSTGKFLILHSFRPFSIF